MWVVCAGIPALRKPRQEDQLLEASLGYLGKETEAFCATERLPPTKQWFFFFFFLTVCHMLCGVGGGRDGAGTTLVDLPRNSCDRTSQEPLLLLNSMVI